MPIDIDPETMNVDELPPVWSPVQWKLSDEERLEERETQAVANLLWVADAPEAMLRVLLNECEVEQAFEPPDGYDPEQQGLWEEGIMTYQFKRYMKPIKIERDHNYLYVEYKVEDLGYWAVEIENDKVNIYRI